MRYQDLGIETRREDPARARSQGIALLVRAGYLSSDYTPTMLGQRAIARLQSLLAGPSNAVFVRLPLPIIKLDGGYAAYEMTVGDLEILRCRSCGYAARLDEARFRKTPEAPEPQRALQKVPTPQCDTIDTLAGFLRISITKTAKALMYRRVSDGGFVIVALRGDMQASERKLHRLVGDILPATLEDMSRVGATPGYASPIGLRGALIIADDLVPQSPNLVAGANEPGFHFLNTNYGRDYLAQTVADVALARAGDPCPDCGAGLAELRAITLVDAGGIHFDGILRALAESFHDGKGLCIPQPLAPFDVYLVHLASRQMDTRTIADKLHKDLSAAGIAVLYDDREERAGVKFNDADLIGSPLRLTVGEKNLGGGMVEMKRRVQDKIQLVPLKQAVDVVLAQVQTADV